MEKLSAYLTDVLALELGDESVQALVVSLDTDGVEDSLDVGSRGGGVATKAEEEVSCEVLHFEGIGFSEEKMLEKDWVS